MDAERMVNMDDIGKTLTEGERREALSHYFSLDVAIPALGNRPARWSDLLPDEQRAAVAKALAKRRTRSAAPVAAPAENSGRYVTEDEAVELIKRLCDIVREHVEQRIAAAEIGAATSIEAALAAAEAATRVVGKAAGGATASPELDELRQQVAALQESQKSFERRQSRHAEHLAGLESRLKKVERDR